MTPSETCLLISPNPILHAVERFSVRDVIDYGDVVCVLTPVEHVLRDLELKRVVRHCRNLVGFVAADCHRVHDV